MKNYRLEHDDCGGIDIKIADFVVAHVNYHHAYNDNVSRLLLAEQIVAILTRTPAPTGWIAIKDRPPIAPCVVRSVTGRLIVVPQDDNSPWDSHAHWTPLPPPPPNPDEQAFEKAQEKINAMIRNGVVNITKEYFLAGIERGIEQRQQLADENAEFKELIIGLRANEQFRAAIRAAMKGA